MTPAKPARAPDRKVRGVCVSATRAILLAWALLAWALLAGEAAAASLTVTRAGTLPPLPGIGAADGRIPVLPDRPPLSAVLRLNVAGVARCTAVIVGSHWVATAAHCLSSRRLGHPVAAGSVHLLQSYDRGAYRAHLTPDAILRLPGTGLFPRAGEGRDLALLHLRDPAAPVLPLLPAPPAPGTRLQLAGFGQDRAERLLLDPDCAVLDIQPGLDAVPVLVHDCAGTRGSSGGALLTQDGRLAGIALAARMNGRGGLALAAPTIRALLDAAVPAP